MLYFFITGVAASLEVGTFCSLRCLYNNFGSKQGPLVEIMLTGLQAAVYCLTDTFPCFRLYLRQIKLRFCFYVNKSFRAQFQLQIYILDIAIPFKTVLSFLYYQWPAGAIKNKKSIGSSWAEADMLHRVNRRSKTFHGTC